MIRMRNWAALVLFLCLALSGCSNETKTHPKLKRPVRLVMRSDPNHLDPRKASDGTSGLFIRMLFDGLTRFDHKGNPQLSLAKSYTLSPDGKTYTFKLKEAYWSNGQPIESDHFVYSWKTTLNPTFPSQNAYFLYPIKNAEAIKLGKEPIDSLGIRAIDSQTLEIELEKPTHYFLELLAFDAYFPVFPGQEYDPKVPESLVHCGPFSLLYWENRDELALIKNKGYWDAYSVKLDGITLAFINDDHTALNLFEKNLIDWFGTPFGTIPIDSYPHLMKSDSLYFKPGNFSYWLVLNTRIPPYNNKNIRHALNLSLNRVAIVNALQGKQVPAYGFLPPQLTLTETPFFYEDSEVAYHYFKKGLEELNLALEHFPPLKLTYNYSPLHSIVAQMVQQQWKSELGIEVELLTQEWHLHNKTLSDGNFEVGRYGWRAQFSDPINYLEIFEKGDRSAGGYNYTGWEHKQYRELLQAARENKNLSMRRSYLKQAERLLMDEMPVITLFHDTSIYLKNPNLQGVVVTPLGHVDFKWASWK